MLEGDGGPLTEEPVSCFWTGAETGRGLRDVVAPLMGGNELLDSL